MSSVAPPSQLTIIFLTNYEKQKITLTMTKHLLSWNQGAFITKCWSPFIFSN